MRKIIYILLICSVGTFAIEHYGSFAEWNVGARSLAMGRAYVGLADDASSLFWNPAGVMRLKSMQAMFQMVMLYEQYNMMYAGFALPGAESALGVEFLMLGGSGIEGRDKYNQFTQMVQDSKMAIGLTYSKRVMQNVFMGLKGKYFMRTLGADGDMAIAGDISLMYTLTEQLSLGWSLNNVVGMVMGDTSDQLLSNSIVGLSYREKDLIFTIDARDNFNDWHFGAEWLLFKMLALRCGVNNYELSFGGGLNVGILQFDFAYVMKELGSNIAFSTNLSFGDSMDNMQQSKIEAYIEEAKELLLYDYFYLAKKKFENILLLDPNKQEVSAILDRINLALPHIDSTLEKELASWDRFKEGKKLFDANKYEEALRNFEEVQKINFGNRFVIYYIDECKQKIGK
ncbi:MAG: hypothetical protein PHV30_01775 [Candidatus Margulisbacteria bacterium]|nr:hypothetical protein [Candidatus Margulisiibacteriota bacterium]